MKRIHIHVGVEDIGQSINFYNSLFGTQPVKTKVDYAKWMLDDPRINFAISTRSGKTGVDHLGLQVDEPGDLDELRERMKTADMSVFDEGETVCCYAQADKSWVEDPSGIAWETFRTMADAKIFSEAAKANEEACCTPKNEAQPGCCEPSDGPSRGSSSGHSRGPSSKAAGCCSL